MTGWLIVNEFLQSNKFNEIHSWLLKAAKEQGINLILKTNGDILIDINTIKDENSCISSLVDKVDFVLFWDKDVRLARYLEQIGLPVFNSSEAIAICDDKSHTHIRLMKSGIPMPRTIIAPMTFENIGYTNLDFLQNVSKRLGFPIVIKECFGSFGQQVYLVNDYHELEKKVLELGAKPILFQKFINSSFGKDIRLQVVGSEVIASMLRYSESGDFRANLSIGGRMEVYNPSKEQIELALRCCREIGLDFAGVDILFGGNDQPIVCEVNSNAHFKNIFECTGVNAADKIIQYIKNSII